MIVTDTQTLSVSQAVKSLESNPEAQSQKLRKICLMKCFKFNQEKQLAPVKFDYSLLHLGLFIYSN